MATEVFDVVIVGAGLSGIGAAVHLQNNCPNKVYTVLEGRDAIGGTWDLFRYPGIRSDSDMFTLGYNFKPWEGKKTIADGDSIRNYVNEAADEHDVRQHIRFNHWVESLSWDTQTALWTITAVVKKEGKSESVTLQTKFLLMCSGYYRYDQGYTPEFKGIDNFKGQVIHPQHWPESLDYEGKRVVVIGSGATAVTLVPSMTDKAKHVTMLQRSPTYILSMPDEDPASNALRKVLPSKLAYKLIRARNVTLSMGMYQVSRWKPEWIKKLLRKQYKHLLGEDFDIDKHLTPDYNPWDQRLCMVPNADLFKVIRNKQASIETGHIDTFTEKGIRLTSGEELEADIVITATGLDLVALGGAKVFIDGKETQLNQHFSYKGMMMSGIPNMVGVIGYTNASWTLKADLTLEYSCRLLNLMDEEQYDYCMPVKHEDEPAAPMLDMNSGYVLRALDRFPKAGAKAPWKVSQNYLLDLKRMRFSSVMDESMQFYKKG